MIFSCDSKDEERKILLEEVSEMEKDLDNLKSRLVQNKIDTLSGLELSISSVLLRFKNNLALTEIDSSLNKKMNDYKVIGKNLRQNHRIYSKALKAYDEEKIALKNLKYDIENGLGEFDKYKDYISFEQQKVEIIKKLTESFVTEKNKNIKQFKSIHPELYTYSLEILK